RTRRENRARPLRRRRVGVDSAASHRPSWRWVGAALGLGVLVGLGAALWWGSVNQAPDTSGPPDDLAAAASPVADGCAELGGGGLRGGSGADGAGRPHGCPI